MLEEEEEELDDEIIQARVDASLAKIYSVTSTWLKPKKTPSAPKKDFEKELEDTMRRPPRLGVGAELPEKQMKSGPGELKLKNKMLGNKRKQEGANFSGSPDLATLEDDDEESKSRVIQKKPRLDLFAQGKKKGKGLNAPATVLPHKLVSGSPASETRSDKEKAAIPKDEAPLGSTSSRIALACEPTPGGDEEDEEEEGKQYIAKGMAMIHKPTPNPPPVSYLQGPPTIQGAAELSPKNKKKRRKKRKKHHAGGVTVVAPQTSTMSPL